MNNEDFVIVYWNNTIKATVRLHGSSSIVDMDEFAKIYVPEGIHYNIVHKKDISQTAVPRLTNQSLTLESQKIKNLFYEYFGAL
jgi:formylmethanofuran dehydrogenase subunit D